ncbi:hypothetical protein LOTGIDRAFT_113326 [Lottia gigantea]|uniref:Major facilitator superfamily (MFS) profile domain-containing protein n=1 Tax=Lottia gigantea TaxID=225164 RepID=V4AQI1_LOTGI|nr:hypothetical protein LOTGIDRAFT_113326 [Lottia gigantea]ESO99487.1 hypothetical protein LOTGIDRAFT_113326 [Lottia gigantea]
MVFFGCAVHFGIRTNLSVAIVCMVNSTGLNSTTDLINNHTRHSFPLSESGNLDWSSNEQTGLLSSFFYGYIILQLPGGWIASKFGAKRLVGAMMTLAGLITITMPLVAKKGIIYMYISRFLVGLFGGAIYPSLFCLFGRWAPPLERTKLIALASSGCAAGVIITMTGSGLLCDYGFAGGWPSIFYLTGIFAIFWSVVWMLVVSDTPCTSKNITEEERKYIVDSLPITTVTVLISKKVPNTDIPWLSILTSPATWACAIGNFCTDWVDYTLLTCLPLFMKDVLKYDIKSNGVYSTLPPLTSFIMALISSYLADTLRSKQLCNTINTRKAFQCTGKILLGFLIGTGYISIQERYLAVVFLSLSTAALACSSAGYIANIVDFAPRYSGIICGICNFVGTIPGMVAPIVAGALTPNKSQEEWRHVFYLGALVCVVGAVLYAILARASVQSWAISQLEITVPLPSDNIQSDSEFHSPINHYI